ncbi:histidinol-phosphate transaminase [Thiolapillus brandeum]|nr:histidinol-phosphate transaminase [Thiolapillus brandeum]
MEQRVQSWIRPEIQALSAYHVPDASELVKLDAMENPYTWPQDLRREWLKRLSHVDVNRYPDPRAKDLAGELRLAMQVPGEMAVLLGNGSDEIIQMLALAVSGQGRSILSVEPGFVMYSMIATWCGMDYHGVPLRGEDFSLDMPALRLAIGKHQPALIFLACPNNPTGNLFADEEIVEVLEMAPGLVVVDEAYAPFTDHSFMSRLGRFDNLLVMRTVSKLGLAGLRLGMLAGPQAWLDEIDKVRMPYNINVLTQETARFALEHHQVLDEQTRAIRRDRQKMFESLQGMQGITAYPSQANFILARTAPGRAQALFEHLLNNGVLVKKLHGSHPLLEDCLRFTVGRPEENRQLLELLEGFGHG